jgi:hypothetical protein
MLSNYQLEIIFIKIKCSMKKILFILWLSITMILSWCFPETNTLSIHENNYKNNDILFECKDIKTFETNYRSCYLSFNWKIVWDSYSGESFVSKSYITRNQILENNKITQVNIGGSKENKLFNLYVDPNLFKFSDFLILESFLKEKKDKINEIISNTFPSEKSQLWYLLYANYDNLTYNYHCNWWKVVTVYPDKNNIHISYYTWNLLDSYNFIINDNSEFIEDKSFNYSKEIISNSIKYLKTCKNKEWKYFLDIYKLKQ